MGRGHGWRLPTCCCSAAYCCSGAAADPPPVIAWPIVCPTADPTATPAAVLAIWANMPGWRVWGCPTADGGGACLAGKVDAERAGAPPNPPLLRRAPPPPRRGIFNRYTSVRSPKEERARAHAFYKHEAKGHQRKLVVAQCMQEQKYDNGVAPGDVLVRGNGVQPAVFRLGQKLSDFRLSADSLPPAQKLLHAESDDTPSFPIWARSHIVLVFYPRPQAHGAGETPAYRWIRRSSRADGQFPRTWYEHAETSKPVCLLHAGMHRLWLFPFFFFMCPVKSELRNSIKRKKYWVQFFPNFHIFFLL